MFPVEAFERTIAKFVDIVNTLGIRFHLTGGAISSAYGEPRLTQDIDIVIDPVVAKQSIDALVGQLSHSDFMFTESVVRAAVERADLFQLLDKSESLKLDIYPRELIPGELNRSQKMELFEGVFLPVVSRLDAAISKLIWIDKGSQRSRRDLRGLFRNSAIDEQIAIQNWASEIGFQTLLAEVLSEPDEIR